MDLPTSLAIEDMMHLLKGASSHWINERNLLPGEFAWGRGYGAFSVSHSGVGEVAKYIELALSQAHEHSGGLTKGSLLLLAFCLANQLLNAGQNQASRAFQGRADGVLGLLQAGRSMVLACGFSQVEQQAFARPVKLVNQCVLLAPMTGPSGSLGREGQRLSIDLRVLVGETQVQNALR